MRAKAILQADVPYNIAARCINREWFSIPMPNVWEIFSEELARTSEDHNLVVHSFVLMSNHFHMLASTPAANISQCMHQFMSRSSRRLTREGNRINQSFAGRHFKCVLHQHNYFLNAYKYNYRNPVAAGACDLVENYPFSTLQSLVGQSKLKFPLADDELMASDPVGTLQWLNTPPDPRKAKAHRAGTRRPFFRSAKDPGTNRPVLSETDLL